MFSETVRLRRTLLSKQRSRRRYEELKENALYRRQRRIIFTRVLGDSCGPNSPTTVCTIISLTEHPGRRTGRTAALTLRLLMSYVYGAPSKARNANVVYIWTYVWQR